MDDAKKIERPPASDQKISRISLYNYLLLVWIEMGKGKGRQSGGFGYKCQRAVHSQEIQEQITKHNNWSHSRRRQQSQQQQRRSSGERPKIRLGQLKGIIRERQTHDSFLLAQRRVRRGFLPSPNTATSNSSYIEIVSHPPGFILNYGKNTTTKSSPNQRKELSSSSSSPSPSPTPINAGHGSSSLQEKCLTVLASHIMDYLEVMGEDYLHDVLALLPSDTLAELSIAVSSADNIGITNSLAIALGKHPHVEALSFRAASQWEESLTDDGILELVPPLFSDDQSSSPNNDDILESWEDATEEEEDREETRRHSSSNSSNLKMMGFDMLKVDGCNLKLKRLELIDCQSLTSDALITFFQRCSCITHLSLAGSLPSIQDGSKLFNCLPDLLPGLQVLDVTRCAWVSTSALDSFVQGYYEEGKDPPTVHCEGCFRTTYHGTKLDW